MNTERSLALRTGSASISSGPLDGTWGIEARITHLGNVRRHAAGLPGVEMTLRKWALLKAVNRGRDVRLDALERRPLL